MIINCCCLLVHYHSVHCINPRIFKGYNRHINCLSHSTLVVNDYDAGIASHSCLHKGNGAVVGNRHEEYQEDCQRRNPYGACYWLCWSELLRGIIQIYFVTMRVGEEIPSIDYMGMCTVDYHY